MKYLKSALLTGVSVTTLGLSGAGVASAHAANGAATQPRESLATRIATKFNLNKDDVQKAIEQYRSEHKADIVAKRTAALQQAVADGKLTQAQADYITNAWKEIDSLVVTAKQTNDKNSDAWKAVKQKVDDLKQWAKEQKISSQYVLYPTGWNHHHGWNMRGDHDKNR